MQSLQKRKQSTISTFIFNKKVTFIADQLKKGLRDLPVEIIQHILVFVPPWYQTNVLLSSRIFEESLNIPSFEKSIKQLSIEDVYKINDPGSKEALKSVITMISERKSTGKLSPQELFKIACTLGKGKFAKELIDQVTGDAVNRGFQAACRYGYLHLFQILLKDKRVEPALVGSYSLRLAARGGHYEIVDALLKDGRADPTANNYSAIVAAQQYGHDNIVELLKSDERVWSVFK